MNTFLSKILKTFLLFFSLTTIVSSQAIAATLQDQKLTPGETAVIIVDVPKDFTEEYKGTLAVGNSKADYINSVVKATKQLKDMGYVIIAPQDYHPKDHMSFASNNPGTKVFDVKTFNDGSQEKKQVMWPDHCVQGTPGSDLLVDKDLIDTVFKKGTDPKFDSYSGFKDDGGKNTGLEDYLKSKKIKNVVVYGIATDYCVKATVLHAIEAGLKVYLVPSLVRGVQDDTSKAALDEMVQKGAMLVDL